MTYNVHQPWDPLKVCIVGKSYSPEFYSYIKNSKVRSVMERIATETEEDYQSLIKLLESFGVEVHRPIVHNQHEVYFKDGRYNPPPMCPRDWTVMIGDKFYSRPQAPNFYNSVKAESWPGSPTNEQEFQSLPEHIKLELRTDYSINDYSELVRKNPGTEIHHIIELLKQQGNEIIYEDSLWHNGAMISRIGKDLYFGTEPLMQNEDLLAKIDQQWKNISTMHPDYRCHVINTGGHSDGTYCPVKPGLIVSLFDIPSYADTYPDWEVIYLPGQHWGKVQSFLDLRKKNNGKWWVPGEELNDDFTNYVEHWLGHWVGYVEETVFDVNMLVIDEKNVVCNNYNEDVFKAFDRYGITPHIVNFRHRYFWDGGLHCITSDIHREGTQKDYFPERG